MRCDLLLVLLLVSVLTVVPLADEDVSNPVLDYPTIYINPYFWIFPIKSPEKQTPITLVPDDHVDISDKGVCSGIVPTYRLSYAL